MNKDFIDRHHLVPKSRIKKGEKRLARNRVRLYRQKHDAWHILFGDKTLDEILLTLIRLRRFKSRR